MKIADAKVIVTGGSAGIGYEIAKALRAQGAQVVICGRDHQKVIKAAKELGVHGIDRCK